MKKTSDFEVGKSYEGWLIVDNKTKYLMATHSIDEEPIKFNKVMIGGRRKATHLSVEIWSDPVEYEDVELEEININLPRSYVNTFRDGYLSYDRFLEITDIYIKEESKETDRLAKLKLSESYLEFKYKYYENVSKNTIPHSDSNKYAEDQLNSISNELLDLRDEIIDMETK